MLTKHPCLRMVLQKVVMQLRDLSATSLTANDR